MSRFVATPEELDQLVADLAGSELLAIDTEFLREKTYYAKLCLIQINNGDIQAIIDPLALKSLDALVPILTDPACTKVFHAGSQDIGILYHETGVMPAPVFDTQTAAALLGHPLQMGYGPLVKAMCDVKLAKADSYTDWSRRPLTKDQVRYALDDVVYLPEMYRMMTSELEERGRLSWLDEDFATLADPARYENVPEEMWRRVKRVSSLSRRQLAIARGVAAWRESEAMRRDIPRRWVMSDEAVVEIARKAPRDVDRLMEVRELNNRLSMRASREVLAAVKEARELPESELPRIDRAPHGAHEIDGVVDLMAAVVEIRAKENDVAPPVLASKDDLSRLARGHRDDSALLMGWRYEMVGRELIDLLEGRLVLYVNDGAIQVAAKS